MIKNNKRTSSVSKIMKKIILDPAPTELKKSSYTISLAINQCDLNKAYQLGHEVYLKKDYIIGNENKLLKMAYDNSPYSTVLLAVDETGNPIATVTLVLGYGNQIPCAETFDIDEKMIHKVSIELTRLALADNYRSSIHLLIDLMVWAYIFAEEFTSTECFIAEVNPRHQKFYNKILGFDPIEGFEQQACSRVLGAPAVLMSLEFEKLDSMKLGQNWPSKRFEMFLNAYEDKKGTIINEIRNSLKIKTSSTDLLTI